MSTPTAASPHTPLRLWPGVVIVLLQWLTRFVLPGATPEIFGMDTQGLAVIGGLVGGLAVVVWWLFFSGARWPERLAAVAVMIVAIVAIRPFTHPSIQNGMMGMMFVIYAIPPTLSLALVGWAAASQRLSAGARRAAMVAAIVAGCGVWTLARTNGILGGGSDLAWRWTPTAEERLLAQTADEPVPVPAPASAVTSKGTPTSAGAPADKPAPAETAADTPTSTGDPVGATRPALTPPAVGAPAGSRAAAGATTPAPAAIAPGAAASATMRAEWPGFRGPARDGVVRGVRIRTDWSAAPPVQVWRRPIGPGWSSFAVRGDLLYTQEQRGDDEIVACYRVSSGEPVWRHRDAVRFWESNGGAGPRATPTLGGNRVYTFGATGIVNALDAATGRVVWSRNAASDTGRKVPDWGFAASPLVVDDVVVVAVSGTLAGYDVADGTKRWVGPAHGGSYSSPQLAVIDGIAQIVLLHGAGATGVAAASGELLWEHAWPGSAIVQPALTANGDIVINTIASTGGVGTRRLAVVHDAGGWSVQERWTSSGLKPYFNDFVVHKGHAFGFDGSILACIDLEDGRRKWKGGRYGNGQLVLLPDQDVLLVLSEEGEIALVRATPDQFTELARFPALDGKTWNHPVLVGDLLLVRNGEEMAAFRLAVADR